MNTKNKWSFAYDESLEPDVWGCNEAGVLTDGVHFLFYHALKRNVNDAIETCYIYDSLTDLFECDNEVCHYPWTSENDEVLLNALNNLDNPEDYCGAGSPIEVLEFIPYKG